MKRPLLDESCLVCGYNHTPNGHICALCLISRYGTRHPNWTSNRYLAAMKQAAAIEDQAVARVRTVKARTEGQQAA